MFLLVCCCESSLILITNSFSAAAELVKQVLEAPGIYVFGELLDMPNIVEVPFLFIKLYR